MSGSTVDGEAVVLAALLHDIGTFWQRAGASAPPADEGADEDASARARLSAAFYQQMIPPVWHQGGNADLLHHPPMSYAARIVAVANQLASGDRDGQDPVDAPRSARLHSIFRRIYTDRGDALPDSTFPLAPLQLTRDTLYPHAGRSSVAADEFRRLWDGFVAEARGLGGLESFPSCVTTLLALLEKYTWCVSSAADRSGPDVSLYDHARIAASLAACLWQSAPSESALVELLGDRDNQSSAATEPRFALIAGDLSGVQHFLYTIASRGAARTLRGRSLFLQLLSEAAVDFVLRALALPPVNLLYVGGAKFYVLAPAGAIDSLDELRRRLDGIFLKVADGEISLALAGVPLSAADIAERFRQAWSDVGARLHEMKSRRYSGVARTHYARLFEPSGVGGPVSAGDVCDVCGRELGADEPATIRDGVLRCANCHDRSRPARVPVKICVICRAEIVEGKRRDESVVCARCDGFRELGETVARPGGLFLTVSDDDPPANAAEWQKALARFGRFWEWSPRPRFDRSGALAWAVNDLDFRRSGAHGFRLSGIVAPLIQQGEPLPTGLEDRDEQRPGAAKSFEWLAESAQGVPYLGVLRMDVDGLGQLFREGLGDAVTPSRMASLSRNLRLFFEGWLGPLVREVDRDIGGRGEQLSVIYSGGDDLFVVGPWNRLPILARAIRREFGAYCASNPAVTISAGVAVADPHYPLYQFADDAKKALDDRAKQFRRDDGRHKDALSFLGTDLGWEDFDVVYGDVKNLERLVGGNGQPAGCASEPVPRALVHGLSRAAQEYHEQCRQTARAGSAVGVNPGRLYYGRWLWMAHYQLRRLTERIRDTSTRQEVQALTESLITPTRIKTLGLIARWTEYLVRQGENSETR